MAADTRGTSNLQIGSGKVWSRRIHVRIDEPGYLEHVLPHELTHVVLADRFSTQQIPRWADEGIAMLNEPAQRREELNRVLSVARRNGQTIPLRELLTAREYPSNLDRARVFFAQSVALVDYLKSHYSGSEVIQFIETSQRGGYDQAIRAALSIDGIAGLETRWISSLAETKSSRLREPTDAIEPTISRAANKTLRPGG